MAEDVDALVMSVRQGRCRSRCRLEPHLRAGEGQRILEGLSRAPNLGQTDGPQSAAAQDRRHHAFEKGSHLLQRQHVEGVCDGERKRGDVRAQLVIEVGPQGDAALRNLERITPHEHVVPLHELIEHYRGRRARVVASL